MILFKPYHVGAILVGWKTETRRLWPKGCRVREGAEHQIYTRAPFQGGRPFARIQIVKVWRERLDAIDEAGAQREGYHNRPGYLRAFDEINFPQRGLSTRVVETRRARARRAPVWCVRFRLLAGELDEAIEVHTRLMNDLEPLLHGDGYFHCRCPLAWWIRGASGFPPGPAWWPTPPRAS